MTDTKALTSENSLHCLSDSVALAGACSHPQRFCQLLAFCTVVCVVLVGIFALLLVGRNGRQTTHRFTPQNALNSVAQGFLELMAPPGDKFSVTVLRNNT